MTRFCRYIVVALIATFFTIGFAQAQNQTQNPSSYLGLTVGKASGEDGGTSGAVGFYGTRFGFEVGFIGNSEETGALDYPVPHDYYRSLGTKRIGNTWGLDGLIFLTNTSLRPFIGVGVYFSETGEIAQSKATGWFYTQSTKDKTELAGSLGLHYTAGSIVLGVAYHTVRGPGATLGFTF